MRQLHPFTTITHLASQDLITPATEDDFPIQFLFRKQNGNEPTPQPLPRRHGFALMRDLVQRAKLPTAEWTDKLAGLADADVQGTTLQHTSTSRPSSMRSPSIAWFSADHAHQTAKIGVRVEGPYFTPADPSRYRTVICVVAGTGVSGAIAIAGAFAELQRQRAVNLETSNNCESSSSSVPRRTSTLISSSKVWERCVVVWSVRAEDHIDLPFLKSK